MDNMQHTQLHLSQGNIETTYQLLVTEKGRAALLPFRDRLKTMDDFDIFVADNQDDIQEHDHVDPQTGKIIPAYVSAYMNADGSKGYDHVIFMQHGQYQDPHNEAGQNLRMDEQYNSIPVGANMIMHSNGRLEVTYYTIGDEVAVAPSDTDGNVLINPVTGNPYPYNAMYNSAGEIIDARHEDCELDGTDNLIAYNKLLKQFSSHGKELSTPVTAWKNTVSLKNTIY